MTKSSDNSHSKTGTNGLTSLRSLSSYQAGILQARATRMLRKLTDDALREFDLTSAQWFMIGAVYDAGSDGISVSDLSRALGTNRPFVTNTANDLESRRILERSSPDGNARMKLLRLHPGYLPLVPRIEQKVRHNLRQTVYSQTTPDELLAYINSLIRFSEITI